MVWWRNLVATMIALMSVIATAVADPPASTGPSETTPTEAGSTAPIERVVTIGASATAGFGVYFWRFEDETRVRDSTNLAKILRAATDGRFVVSSLGTGQFFLNPEGLGTMVVERALRQRPDLVVALDFLFWFTYGTVGPDARPMRTHEQRLEMLEHGLALLDRLVESGVPLVLGDVPDMSKAGGGILLKSQVPPEETRVAANERIRAWIAERPTVRFLSLDRLQRMLQGDEPIEVAGERIPDSERPYLLQQDRLHPTVGGLSIMVNELLALLAADPELGDRVPPLDVDYRGLVERVTGLPELRLQDPLERAYQAEREKVLREE